MAKPAHVGPKANQLPLDRMPIDLLTDVLPIHSNLYQQIAPTPEPASRGIVTLSLYSIWDLETGSIRSYSSIDEMWGNSNDDDELGFQSFGLSGQEMRIGFALFYGSDTHAFLIEPEADNVTFDQISALAFSDAQGTNFPEGGVLAMKTETGAIYLLDDFAVDTSAGTVTFEFMLFGGG